MVDSVTRYVRTEDGVRISFEFSEGRDPVLFVSPVIGSQPTAIRAVPAWGPYIDTLRRDNAMTILSFRGMGLSGPPPGPITLPDLVRDLEAVASVIPDRELYVFASGGGCVPALEFIAAHQERIRGVFLDGPSRFGAPPALRAALKADYQEALVLVDRALFDREQNDDRSKARLREWARGTPEELFWEAVEVCEHYDFESALRRVTVPAVIRGYDHNREEVAELAAEFPGIVPDFAEDQRLGAAEAEHQRALMEPYLAQRPANGANDEGAPGADAARSLTTQQLKVLQLAARGASDKAIAEALSITTGTARRHMSDVLKRTGQPNRTAAAYYGREHGLID